MVDRECHRDHERFVGEQDPGAIDHEQHSAACRYALQPDRVDSPPQPVEPAQQRGADQVGAEAAAQARIRREQIVERGLEGLTARSPRNRVPGERRVDLALEHTEPVAQRPPGGRRRRPRVTHAPSHDTQVPDCGVGWSACRLAAIALVRSIGVGHVGKLGDAQARVKLDGPQIDTSREPQL